MLHALVLAALGVMPPCWDVFDAALRRSANAPHPPYVTYSERIAVSEDGAPIIASIAHIDYRDDGLARVSDERFDYEPYFTRHAEPGPPELGPYGPGRSMWLPLAGGLPIIAHVRSLGDVSCTVAGEDRYKSHDTYHLVFRGAPADVPTLEDLWVDVRTHDIWKLIVTGPVAFWDDPRKTHPLARFEVELRYSGPYLVVDHVVWSYSRREWSQRVEYFGEYTFADYAFPSQLPPSDFADAGAAFK